MRYALLLLTPLALVAAVVAQDAVGPEDLVKKLGDDDYAVREEATRTLIEMGDKAVPALEKALESDDLEVRLRAGRALRAIRQSGKPEAGEKPASAPTGEVRAGTSSGLELSIMPGKVKLRRTEFKDGERKVTEYEAASLEELREKHPELKDVLKGFHVGTGRERRRGDRFDMDKFWEDWGRGFNEDFMDKFREDWGRNFDDDFWKRWRKDVQRRKDLLNRWAEAQRRVLDGRARRPEQAGRELGIRGTRPDKILDAQLQLRGRGVVVEGVEKNTPADRLGLQRYDVITDLNGVEIRSFDDLRRAQEDAQEGVRLKAKVIRRGRPVELPQ